MRPSNFVLKYSTASTLMVSLLDICMKCSCRRCNPAVRRRRGQVRVPKPKTLQAVQAPVAPTVPIFACLIPDITDTLQFTSIQASGSSRAWHDESAADDVQLPMPERLMPRISRRGGRLPLKVWQLPFAAPHLAGRGMWAASRGRPAFSRPQEQGHALPARNSSPPHCTHADLA